MLYIILMSISHFTSFANELLLAIYFICTLDHGNDVRQKTNLKQFSYSSSKWVIKQQKQLPTSTVYVTEELLMKVQCSGGKGSFANEARALKTRSAVAGHWKLTIESNYQIGSSYNYTRSCQRTQSQPFYSYLAFEPNWKGEKVQ